MANRQAIMVVPCDVGRRITNARVSSWMAPCPEHGVHTLPVHKGDGDHGSYYLCTGHRSDIQGDLDQHAAAAAV